MHYYSTYIEAFFEHVCAADQIRKSRKIETCIENDIWLETPGRTSVSELCVQKRRFEDCDVLIALPQTLKLKSLACATGGLLLVALLPASLASQATLN